jgi:hypothetical protein
MNTVKKTTTSNGTAGFLWFLGFLGTVVYFIQFHSGSFWLVVQAFFKAFFWPAFLVYELFRYIHV